MYCTQCGKELKEGIKFCTNCGSVIKSSNNDPETVSQMNLSEDGRDRRTDVPYKTPAKKNKKGALIAIIVLLIVLILGVSGASWYIGSISADEFSESMLNEYEIANRDLIVEYEKEMGYR